MKHTGAKVVLGIDALLFLLFGILYCLDPVKMAASVGIPLNEAGAIIDVQGLYGGLEMGLGLFLGICARTEATLAPGLLAGSLTLGGIALTRMLAIARFGAPNTTVLGLVALDSIGALINTGFLLKTARKLRS